MIQVKKEVPWGNYDVLINIDKDHSRQVNSKQVEKQLNADWMYLDNGKYNRDNWKVVFQRIRKSQVKRLILQKNDRPTLIKQLSNINFIQLNVLNLSKVIYQQIRRKQQNQQLRSIINDQFAESRMVIFRYLELSYIYEDNNDIVSLKSLVKSTFGQLKKLHFNENRIKQIQTSRFDFGRCFMSFESEISAMNRISQQDLSFLVKMNCLTIKSITFCGKKRIKQQEVYNAIENRFNETHFNDDDTNLEMMHNQPMFF